MKVHLIRIAVLVLAVVSPLLATPVAARPKDPDSFLVTPVRQGGCNFRTSFGDPPRTGLCPSGSPELTATQPVSQRPAEAQRLLRDAVAAVTRAGALQYTLEMRTTTNIRGGSWTAKSTFVGDYAAPDESARRLDDHQPLIGDAVRGRCGRWRSLCLPSKPWCERESGSSGAMRRTRFASRRRCGCRTMQRRPSSNRRPERHLETNVGSSSPDAPGVLVSQPVRG